MKHKRFIWFGLGIVLFLVVSACWAQQEQWLGYHSMRKAYEVLGNVYWRYLELSSARPEGLQLPSFESEEPFFAKWSSPMAKRGHLWIALDRSSKSAIHDRLYIDSNGDGSLADETATVAYQGERQRTYFGPVKVMKTPSCAPAPMSSVLGLAMSGPKSVMAPRPRKMMQGMTSHLRP